MRPLTDAEYRPILNVQSNQLCPQFRKQNVQFKVQKCAVQQRKIIKFHVARCQTLMLKCT